jgi:uncharacterized membrane protein
MTLEPILSAGNTTQIHLATISAAFAIGSWLMLRPKGTPPHRALGMFLKPQLHARSGPNL